MTRALQPATPPPELASRGRCVLALTCLPVTWLAVILSLGMAVALSSVGVFAGALGLTVLLTWVVAGRPSVQRDLEQRRRSDRRSRARCVREERLEEANVLGSDIHELTGLVTEVERTSPELMDRYELDALLDRYVEVVLAEARCKRALYRIDRAFPLRAFETTDDVLTACHRELITRRNAYRERYDQLAYRLHAETIAIGELIRLVALRVALPEISGDGADVVRRIAQLDDDDLARRQVDEL